MFSFLGSIVGKIASAVVSVFVTVGLVSAPASVTPQPPEEPILIETASSAPPVEIQEEIDIKAELDALKKQFADEQKKRKELEKKVVAPTSKPIANPILAPTPAITTPPSTPVVVTPPPTALPTTVGTPTTVGATTPAVNLLPGQFLLPNGAIVDSLGNIIKPAPVVAPTTPSTSSGQTTSTPTTPPPPPLDPTWPPKEGSTMDIKQSMLSTMNFNSNLTCDQLLAIPASQKDLCKLYKEKQDKYTWNIIQDI